MGGPQHPNPAMMSQSGTSILPNRINLPPGSLSQVGHSGPYMSGTGPKQPFYHSSQDLGMPMRPSQSLMGVGGAPRQPTHPGLIVARPGMTGPSLGSPTTHLRPVLRHSTTLPPRMMCASQQQPHSQSQLWQSQQGGHPHMDPVNHQHLFPSGGAPPVCGAPQFPQRPGMPANFTAARPPPNQLAPGLVSRHMQKMPPGQTLPSMSQQSLRMRGPLTAMDIMKPGAPPTMMDPSHGMAPPSYPSVDKHSLTQGYSSGQNPGSKLPSYDYPPQHQSNGSMAVGPQGPVGAGGVGGGEVDFIDTLVGSNDDWLNNLNMIDEYLEQNS